MFGWLDIGVDNMLRMHILHAAKQIPDQAAEPTHNRRCTRTLSLLLLDKLVKVRAAVLRNHAGQLVNGRYIRQLDNVGMV